MKVLAFGGVAAACWAACVSSAAASAPGALEAIGWYTVRQSNMAPFYKLDDTIRLSAVFKTPTQPVAAGEPPYAYLGRPPQFWVAERRRRVWEGGRIEDPRSGQSAPPDPGTTSVKRQWIDGRSCPALEARLALLAKLSFQPPAPGKLEFGLPPSSHFPTVTVTSRTRYGDLRVHDFGIGPLTEWWNGLERDLAPCWREAAVTAGGKALVNDLGSDEAAAALD